MSNQGSSIPLEFISSPQRSAATTNVQGDFSNNRGSYNRFNSPNITNIHNYGGTNLSLGYPEILQCLYTSGYQSHKDQVRQPVGGTCIWVTEHPKYKEWLRKTTSSLLWLSADPGCGKSVIASFLVDHLKSGTGAIVCYFFFKDGNEEQRRATFALCAILHQLFSQRKYLYKYAVEALKTKGKKFTEEVDTLWNILVTAVAEGGCGEVICVVDGLDECEDVTLSQLIRRISLLPESQTSDIPLKFLVTSRPYYRIERDLGSPQRTIRLRAEDEINAITTDVLLVINDGIRRLESFWGQPGELGYLRNLLESSADRTFLWVSLVLEVLKDSVDQSREVLSGIVSSAPRDLPELYTKILDKNTEPDTARRILHIVVAAARPLTLREMHIAFKIRPDHKTSKDIGDIPSGFDRTVKNLCGFFVRVVDSKVYLVHQTAREFLIKGQSSGQGNWQYTLCSKESNFILANICISYLLLDDFETDPLAINSPYRGRDSEYAAYVRKHGFLDYAASNWAGHFRESETRQMELFGITRQICKGGSRRFLTWLKVYWGTNRRYRPFPSGFTHLMIATWLGQQTVVERLLDDGGDMNARSKQYGTAVNVAALQRDEIITRMLVERNIKAYIRGKEYNILQTKRSELDEIINPRGLLLRGGSGEPKWAFSFFRRRPQEQARAPAFARAPALQQLQQQQQSRVVNAWNNRIIEDDEEECCREIEREVIEFLKDFCIPDTPDQRMPDPLSPGPVMLAQSIQRLPTPEPQTSDPRTQRAPGSPTPGQSTHGPQGPDPQTADPHIPESLTHRPCPLCWLLCCCCGRGSRH